MSATTRQAGRQRELDNAGLRPADEPLELDESRLVAWLNTHIESTFGTAEIRRFRGGQSNPTYRLTTAAGSYVLRRKPLGPLLQSAHAVDREYRVLEALYPTGFPVPRPRALCLDEAVIGSTFYVMDMVEGRLFWDPGLEGLTPGERRAMYMAQIEVLARLHSLDAFALGLETFGRPGNYMGRQIARWTRQYRASETDTIAAMDRLIEWLPSTLPEQERSCLVHGDFRLDNLIFDAERPEVAAVLDWELSTLGDPVADFAYLLGGWLNGPLAEDESARAAGLPTEAECIAYYCSLTRRQSLPDLSWYYAFNNFRMAAICQGVAGRVRDGTATSHTAVAASQQVGSFAQSGWEAALRHQDHAIVAKGGPL